MVELSDKLGRNIIITGHFGCGKTNVAVGLALALARSCGVTLVDLDIVNPYFRAADAAALMKNAGIDMIVPRYANTNLDIPSLGGDISAVFAKQERDPLCRAVFDVGGDNGAVALGRYSGALDGAGYTMIYTVSTYRPLTAEPTDAADGLREIESLSRLRASYIINNSNLGDETDRRTIEDSLEYADAVADVTGLPLLCTTLHSEKIRDELAADHPNRLFVAIPDSTRRLF